MIQDLRRLSEWRDREFARRTRALRDGTAGTQAIDWALDEYRLTWSEVVDKAIELDLWDGVDPVGFRLAWDEYRKGERR